MSILTQSLNRIEKWLETTYPQYFDSLSTGLTIEEINNLAINLPFNIPDDVIELYQWHNGSNLYIESDLSTHPRDFGEGIYIFDGKAILTLQSVIETDFRNFDPFWLTLFTDEDNDEYFIMNVSFGNILIFRPSQHGDSSDTYTIYSSLTSMMLTIAEFYELGGDVDDVRDFSDEYQKIWKRYNSDISDEDYAKIIKYKYEP
jgi:cell wall assembly regulator SMI1